MTQLHGTALAERGIIIILTIRREAKIVQGKILNQLEPWKSLKLNLYEITRFVKL
jgi:hypothetical protein